MTGMMLRSLLYVTGHVSSDNNAFQFLGAAAILVKLVVKHGACNPWMNDSLSHYGIVLDPCGLLFLVVQESCTGEMASKQLNI